MKILVTGHRGYIGPHLVKLLKEAGHHVTGVDIGYFEGCNWEPLPAADHEINADFRSLTEKDLAGFDCVCHLAAISNDPMGDLDEKLTYDTNRDGSIELARRAKKAGVPRYLFSGSCSVYGMGEKLDLDETANFNPVSAYAVSKVETEKQVGPLADKDFSPAFLRNATAYGYSPNLRIDLVANNLLACAIARGDIRIMSDGTPWRPLVHCHDIARAFVVFAEAPREKIHNLAVNIGANEQNYQVRDVGDAVAKLVPSAKIVYTGETGPDPRNYRVKFDKLTSLFPDFRLKYNLQSGLEELLAKYREHKFSLKDFEGDQFVRLRAIKKKIVTKK
ncbi:MAG TPA: SDR family oxidoreductase [Candidatus Acidoferrales bacterium]|jgi:nucleoside-diphosphate-sugar epimerase|nr:SDR family oxidoreductase [Candidatus Acidoferrales bacterium]